MFKYTFHISLEAFQFDNSTKIQFVFGAYEVSYDSLKFHLTLISKKMVRDLAIKHQHFPRTVKF